MASDFTNLRWHSLSHSCHFLFRFCLVFIFFDNLGFQTPIIWVIVWQGYRMISFLSILHVQLFRCLKRWGSIDYYLGLCFAWNVTSKYTTSMQLKYFYIMELFIIICGSFLFYFLFFIFTVSEGSNHWHCFVVCCNWYVFWIGFLLLVVSKMVNFTVE